MKNHDNGARYTTYATLDANAPIFTADGALYFNNSVCIREERVGVCAGNEHAVNVRAAFKIPERYGFAWEFSVPPLAPRALEVKFITSRRHDLAGDDLDRLDFEHLRASWPESSPRRIARAAESPLVYINLPPSEEIYAEILLTAYMDVLS